MCMALNGCNPAPLLPLCLHITRCTENIYITWRCHHNLLMTFPFLFVQTLPSMLQNSTNINHHTCYEPFLQYQYQPSHMLWAVSSVPISTITHAMSRFFSTNINHHTCYEPFLQYQYRPSYMLWAVSSVPISTIIHAMSRFFSTNIDHHTCYEPFLQYQYQPSHMLWAVSCINLWTELNNLTFSLTLSS